MFLGPAKNVLFVIVLRLDCKLSSLPVVFEAVGYCSRCPAPIRM